MRVNSSNSRDGCRGTNHVDWLSLFLLDNDDDGDDDDDEDEEPDDAAHDLTDAES